MSKNNILELSRLVRYWSVKLPTLAQSGHPTSSASAVELMSALMFGDNFNFDLENPDNPNNDRIIFSKGHASSLFYALWHVAGVISEKDLKTYRQFGSELEGHPTKKFKYTEVATGSLGQGLAIGLGRALASKIDKINNNIFVLMGDSELAEGSVWEAVQIAGHYKMNNLLAIVDVNGLGQNGDTMTGFDTETIGQRFSAFAWKVYYLKNGNDVEAVHKLYKKILKQKQNGPVVIIAKTTKGFGMAGIAGKQGWHGKALSETQWQEIESGLYVKDFKLKGIIDKPTNETVQNNKTDYNVVVKSQTEKIATRFAIGNALALVADNDKLVFIDAEVGNSTGLDLSKEKADNRYFQSYIAEQTMVGVALGLSLAGKKPVMATFGAFWTRAFDQLRISALNEANMLCIGTHAGVAIGEDGGSQMALEDVAMFRSLFASTVWQPADDVSSAFITELALNNDGINYIRALRQVTPRIYSSSSEFSVGGLNILKKVYKNKPVIIASGTTVHEALKASVSLNKEGYKVGVVDVYCLKPAPTNELIEIAKNASLIITVEDHYSTGGLGEMVNSAIVGHKVKVINLAVESMPQSGSSAKLLAYEKINDKTLVKIIKDTKI